MSTLFLIGNGFDLNCGLKTKYSDVYDEYFKSKSDSEIIKRFKNEIEDNITKWGDFEIAMGQYAGELDGESDFILCANDFQVFMCNYLHLQEQSFYNTIKDSILLNDICDEMRQSINSFYNEVSNNISYEMERRRASNILSVKCVSFNYTSIFDFLIRNSYKDIRINSVIHVHGTLKDPTLGVDNEKQLIVKYPITDKLRRCFIKPFFNEQYDMNRVSQALICINSADTICVFGMSLGLSDLMWRNGLINWLSGSTDRHLFLYDYDYSCKKFKTISDRMNFEEDAKKAKLVEWNIENADELFDRFHIICGNNIFNVEKVIERKRKKIIENGKELVGELIEKTKNVEV